MVLISTTTTQNPPKGVGNTSGVLLKGVKVELGPFEALAGGISNAGGGAADERNNLVASAEEPGKYDDGKEVTEVQALGGGVKTAVDPEEVGASRPEIVAGEGFKQAPFLEDLDHTGDVCGLIGFPEQHIWRESDEDDDIHGCGGSGEAKMYVV